MFCVSLMQGGIQMRFLVVLDQVGFEHRISSARKEKGWGDSSSLKLNLSDPCRTVPCQYHGWGMPGQRAGSPIAVYAVQCQEPKTGQEKVQLYCEDDILFLSSYYLSMAQVTWGGRTAGCAGWFCGNKGLMTTVAGRFLEAILLPFSSEFL